MVASVLGIPDPGIWLAYLLCLAATALCVIYAAIRGRKRDVEPTQTDVVWAKHEQEIKSED